MQSKKKTMELKELSKNELAYILGGDWILLGDEWIWIDNAPTTYEDTEIIQ